MSARLERAIEGGPRAWCSGGERDDLGVRTTRRQVCALPNHDPVSVTTMAPTMGSES